MQFIDAKTVADLLPYDQLIEALRAAFKKQINSPERTQHRIETDDSADATLLMMPAWNKNEHIGIKIVSVFPGNTNKNLSAVNANYFLLDGKNGLPKAILDGTELTLRRTACASALAADYLARSDIDSLLMVGTGNLAPHLIEAHRQLRDISRVMIWGRDYQKAQTLVQNLEYKNIEITDAVFYEGVLKILVIIQPYITKSAMPEFIEARTMYRKRCLEVAEVA